MKKLKVGIVGCGFISHAHMTGWSSIEGIEIVSVCDVNSEKANTRNKEFSVINSSYENYLDMFEKEKFDIVDIITPVDSHKDIVIAAAEKGCHVLCEKPFANNLEDAVEMVKACEKAGKKLMICQTNRWHPWFRTIKKEIEHETIGIPYYSIITQRVSFAIPQGEEGKVALIEDQPFYKNIEKLVLLEQGCHYVDIFRYFFGDAISVTARVKKISPFIIGDDLAIIIIDFPGLTTVLEDSWVCTGSEKTSVTLVEGTKGSLYFEGTSGAAPHRTTEAGGVEIRLRNGKITSIPQDANKYYYNAFESIERHFIDCIKNDKEPISSGRDNLRSLDIIFSAYSSSQIGRTMFLGGINK